MSAVQQQGDPRGEATSPLALVLPRGLSQALSRYAVSQNRDFSEVMLELSYAGYKEVDRRMDKESCEKIINELHEGFSSWDDTSHEGGVLMLTEEVYQIIFLAKEYNKTLEETLVLCLSYGLLKASGQMVSPEGD